MNIETLWIIQKIKIKNNEITSEFLPFVHRTHAESRYKRYLLHYKEKGILHISSKISKEDKNIGENHNRILCADGSSYDLWLKKKTILFNDFLLEDD